MNFESQMSTILEKSRPGSNGNIPADSEFPDRDLASLFPGRSLAPTNLGLPELPEVEVIRHFTNLSSQSHGVDTGLYPLGSCTMKYNPKRNDKLAALEGFRDVHPAQPTASLAGLWQVLFDLQGFIAELTGMDYVSLQPAAGAQGEFAGLLMVRKYFEVRSEERQVVLIPDGAHGTNPSSAAMVGFNCKIIPTTDDGLMNLDALREAIHPGVAAVMLTNPSTLGLFEENIAIIADMAHRNGSLLYYDGANLNALMGIARPGDMGFDVVHINTHKTLSTPHGGGGPGAGPVGVKKPLEPFLPRPVIRKGPDGAFPDFERPASIGRVKIHYGHISVLVRAYAYILTMGAEGLRAASENAVLNANYLQARLRDFLPPVFDKLCMHECLLSGSQLPLSAFSFAKRLIDYGIHPPTMIGAGCVYFPEEFGSAMLIEPTETESKESLDELIGIFRKVLSESLADSAMVETSPHSRKVGKVEAQPTVLDM